MYEIPVTLNNNLDWFAVKSPTFGERDKEYTFLEELLCKLLLWYVFSKNFDADKWL